VVLVHKTFTYWHHKLRGKKQCRIANSQDKDSDKMLMQKKFKTDLSGKRRKRSRKLFEKMVRLTSVTDFIFWFSYTLPLDI